MTTRPQVGIDADAIREKVFTDLASVSAYAEALNKCERVVWSYIAQGLPVTYIGRTPWIVLSLASKYWADRATQRRAAVRRGRPRKQAA